MRKRKKELKIKKNKKKTSLPLINPNSAGIDIGSSEHYVSVPEDRDEANVRSFKSFTCDLKALAKWLKDCGIDSVAMESTGVYWIPLYQLLEKHGFDVKLVNAQHTKNVPGRKTDVLDCQWQQKLNTYGLLRGSFRPEDKICKLRSLLRHRDSLVKNASTHVQRMQKAMTQMNIQLHNVISDITGKTGMKIIKAIIDGERDPVKLANLKDPRIKNSHATLAKSLEGTWREELIYVMKDNYEHYLYEREKIRACDMEIEKLLSTFQSKIDPEEKPLKKAKRPSWKDRNNKFHFDLQKHLYRVTGIDLTKVDGFNTITIMKVISECGIDMSKWPSHKHYSSWLGICPNNKITGNKVQNTKTKKVVNRAAEAFRVAAMSLKHSKSYLGAFYRRINRRHGPSKAITATAHKLAIIFYHMMKYRKEYVDMGMDYYEQKYKERVIKNLKKTAKLFNLEIVENQQLKESVS